MHSMASLVPSGLWNRFSLSFFFAFKNYWSFVRVCVCVCGWLSGVHLHWSRTHEKNTGNWVRVHCDWMKYIERSIFANFSLSIKSNVHHRATTKAEILWKLAIPDMRLWLKCTQSVGPDRRPQQPQAHAIVVDVTNGGISFRRCVFTTYVRI